MVAARSPATRRRRGYAAAVCSVRGRCAMSSQPPSASTATIEHAITPTRHGTGVLLVSRRHGLVGQSTSWKRSDARLGAIHCEQGNRVELQVASRSSRRSRARSRVGKLVVLPRFERLEQPCADLGVRLGSLKEMPSDMRRSRSVSPSWPIRSSPALHVLRDRTRGWPRALPCRRAPREACCRQEVRRCPSSRACP